jgi:hypothetical protein
MKVLFITIATGKYYENFVENLFNSLKENTIFNFDFLCFTDNDDNTDFAKIHTPHLPFPLNTLLRYEIINNSKNYIIKYDYTFYFDADMVAVGKINEEIISDSVHVIHPGFYNKNKNEYSYERNEKSRAYMKLEDGEFYYQGCFQGGKTKEFIKMCEYLKCNIREDLKNNIIAEWWDESHMNKYRFLNPPTKILSPDYALPSNWYGKKEKDANTDINYISNNPVLLHINKNIESIRV